jgi:hypothetical protein
MACGSSRAAARGLLGGGDSRGWRALRRADNNAARSRAVLSSLERGAQHHDRRPFRSLLSLFAGNANTSISPIRLYGVAA